MDTTRSEFADLAADGPAVVRVAAELDVDASPLTAYAALTEGVSASAASGGSSHEQRECDGNYGFLLESAEKTSASDPDGAFRPSDANEDRHARYSFVGYDPAAVVTAHPDGTEVQALRDDRVTEFLDAGDGDVLDQLRGTLPDVERRGFPDEDRQLLDGGLVGFLAYDAVYDLWLDEVGVERPDTPLPDAEFVLTTRTLVFDRATDTVSLVFTPLVGADDDPAEVYDGLVAEAERVQRELAAAPGPEFGGFDVTDERAGPRDDYEDSVEKAKEAVLDGEVYQAVVSRTRELDGDVDPRGLYAALRDVNPSPYMFLLSHDDRTVVGASPETLVAVHDDTVLNNPIAGTCSRGSSPVEDRRLAGEMLADEKERAEHTMLVDLSRNDVRRVSEPGSVRVPEFMRVLKYSHVQHIESTVTGTLQDGRDAFDATRASFPAGTLSGAPKVRAMEHIHALEASPRGIYGGGVGYFSWNGDAEFAITIRSATISHAGERSESAERASSEGRSPSDRSSGRSPREDGDEPRAVDTLRVRAGAGIVADSDPAAEYDETEAKMDGVLAAVDRIREESEEPTPPEVEK
ncbi:MULTISPECIES: anthranilate synthase component I [Halobacterium]|uniref:anthranilate synthase component I n=1 Tax=Halobacterium TaxID=2239 RepID=UPI0009E6D393|nr:MULTISPECIES: anthranilate synthase component I [Halobacterium]MCG1003780.1 anthranilate synthase component I [Halobacterium noricense]